MNQTSENHVPENEPQPGDPDDTLEENQTLWLMTASPLIWAAHFLACYLTAAIWCAKMGDPDGPLGPVRTAIAVYTALAIGGIAAVGWIGFHRHSWGKAKLPHDFDTPDDRHRFLGFATLLLSGLSLVATIYVALAAVFLQRCS